MMAPDRSVPDTMQARWTLNRLMPGSRYWKENPKGVDYMCKAMEDMRKEAMEKGIEQGIENNRLENIRNLMTTMNLTAQQAMDALLIPAAEQEKYIALL